MGGKIFLLIIRKGEYSITLAEGAAEFLPNKVPPEGCAHEKSRATRRVVLDILFGDLRL